LLHYFSIFGGGCQGKRGKSCPAKAGP